MDRNLGSEDVAVDGFQEAIDCLESLKLDSNEAGLEQRVPVSIFCDLALLYFVSCVYSILIFRYSCSVARFLISCTASLLTNMPVPPILLSEEEAAKDMSDAS